MGAVVFFVPIPSLGRAADVLPERLRADHNDWIRHTREILKKRRKAAVAGARPTVYIGEFHEEVKPFGAEHCPAMAELDSIGFLLKWPASAVLKNVQPRGWQIKTPANDEFFRYHPMTSFPEGGEAEAISVQTGWTVVTPPGWSVLLKNVPNNLEGCPEGLTLAEGIVRADRTSLPLQTHARIRPGAPAEIRIKRGDPMAVVIPFRRDELEMAVVDDPALVEEAARRGQLDREAYANAAGMYRKLHVDGDEPNPLYPRLLEHWKARPD